MARKLAAAETILAIRPIEGADAIEVAQVRGWEVVVRKGAFQAGDPVLFIEVDACLPLSDPRFAFLGERGTKKIGGEAYHVLKTARLRGTYSQGIVFPLAEFPEADPAAGGASDETLDKRLGIFVYEPPAPAGMLIRGAFPGWLQKTDAERVQNIDPELWAQIQADPAGWVPTEKVDGSSATIWADDGGDLHVAGRNWELSPEKENAHWAVARQFVAPHLQPGQWVQGEVVGPGVQANPLKLTSQRIVLFGFGTFDAAAPSIKSTSRTPMAQWPDWVRELAAPVYDFTLPESVHEAIDQAEKLRSIVNPAVAAEGIVWTRADAIGLPELENRPVFKSINAAYLAKQK